jgi:copper chaperone CopZ
MCYCGLNDTPDPYQANTMTTFHDTTDRTYTVAGMTCAHCVASVREEVSEVPGVESVLVDLASGRLRVTGRAFADDTVSAAVAEAGYEVIT